VGCVSYYLYGSSARSDETVGSDLDVLVVCTDPKAVDRNKLDHDIEGRSNHGPIDFSIYGISRLEEMYKTGHLFAWHLYKESSYLKGGDDLLAKLGQPAAYDSFREDILSLYELLGSVRDQIYISPNNLVYEAGIAFICARNIAMAASYSQADGPCFSAYAPFLLECNIEFPLSKLEYELLRQARHSGTRGFKAPVICSTNIIVIIRKLEGWAKRVIDTMGKVQ